MKDNPTEQIFDDLFRHLEVLETQSGAILQILKDRGVVDEQQFAAYLEKAAVASDVKWRAARVRMEHLLTSTPEPAKQPPTVETKELPKTEQPAEKSSKNDSENARKEKTEKTTSPESVQFNAPPDRPMTREKSSGSDEIKAETQSHSEKHVETSDEDSKKAASEAGGDVVKPAKQEKGTSQSRTTTESATDGRETKIEDKEPAVTKAKESTVAPKNQKPQENKDAA